MKLKLFICTDHKVTAIRNPCVVQVLKLPNPHAYGEHRRYTALVRPLYGKETYPVSIEYLRELHAKDLECVVTDTE